MIHRDALFIAGVGVLVAMAVLFSFLSYLGRPIAGQPSSVTFNSIPAGDVSVEVQLLAKNTTQITFSISVNTHSVDLSQFNLQDLVTLEYTGKLLRPISAPTLSGHHASGNLVFEINDEADKFVIRVRGIPLELERKFKFP